MLRINKPAVIASLIAASGIAAVVNLWMQKDDSDFLNDDNLVDWMHERIDNIEAHLFHTTHSNKAHSKIHEALTHVREYYYRGNVLIMKPRLEGAIDILVKAMDDDPANAATYRKTIICLEECIADVEMKHAKETPLDKLVRSIQTLVLYHHLPPKLNMKAIRSIRLADPDYKLTPLEKKRFMRDLYPLAQETSDTLGEEWLA